MGRGRVGEDMWDVEYVEAVEGRRSEGVSLSLQTQPKVY